MTSRNEPSIVTEGIFAQRLTINRCTDAKQKKSFTNLVNM